MPAKPHGVILAGGQALRMGGGDKCLIDLDGRTMLTRIMDRLSPQVADCAINANGAAERFDAFKVPVVADSVPDYPGPLAGVLAGLDWAASKGADDVVTVAGDTPFFPDDLVARLISARDAAGTALSMAVTPDPDRGTSRHPTFSLWPVALRDDLRAALQSGVRKVVQWTRPHGCTEVLFPTDPFDPFFNINTADDVAQARMLTAEHAL